MAQKYGFGGFSSNEVAQFKKKAAAALTRAEKLKNADHVMKNAHMMDYHMHMANALAGEPGKAKEHAHHVQQEEFHHGEYKRKMRPEGGSAKDVARADKLKKLAEHPATPVHEAQAAKTMHAAMGKRAQAAVETGRPNDAKYGRNPRAEAAVAWHGTQRGQAATGGSVEAAPVKQLAGAGKSSGEGSRGGVVIGHTKSGEPKYAKRGSRKGIALHGFKF